MKRYEINHVGWNSAHPHRERLGIVWADSPEQARMSGRKLWPCGNGQIYEAVEMREIYCNGGYCLVPASTVTGEPRKRLY